MYIKKFLYGGLDYKDAKEVISQLQWDGRFDVPADAVEACILADIMVQFPYADSECRFTVRSMSSMMRFFFFSAQ
jgi:hypothetical protein